VNVTITGTVDLTLATTGTITPAVGTSESVTTPANNTDANSGSDKAVWVIPSPDLAMTYATGGANTIQLDNIGRKKVKVSAQVKMGDVDSGSAAGKWTMAGAPDVSKFSVGIKATPTLPATNDPTFVGTISTAFNSLGTATPAVDGTAVDLVTGFKKQHDPVQIDLEYMTPTDITANDEFDGSHIVTVTLTGTAD